MAYKTIITCDACGSIVNEDDVSKLDIVYCAKKFDGDGYVFIREDNQIPTSVHYDLCPKCAAKISNYVRNLKDEFNER